MSGARQERHHLHDNAVNPDECSVSSSLSSTYSSSPTTTDSYHEPDQDSSSVSALHPPTRSSHRTTPFYSPAPRHSRIPLNPSPRPNSSRDSLSLDLNSQNDVVVLRPTTPEPPLRQRQDTIETVSSTQTTLTNPFSEPSSPTLSSSQHLDPHHDLYQGERGASRSWRGRGRGRREQRMGTLYNASEWDLSSDSFVGDRGGAAGLVRVHEGGLEKGSIGRSSDEFGRRAGAGAVGRGGKADRGRSQSLEAIPEDASASSSSVTVSSIGSRSSGSRSGSTTTLASSISSKIRRPHKISNLDKDSRYPTFKPAASSLSLAGDDDPEKNEGNGKFEDVDLGTATRQQPLPHLGMQMHTQSTLPFLEYHRREEENGEGEERDWSTDLCGFCDHRLPTCCLSLWCPCLVYSRNKARLRLHEQRRQEQQQYGGSDDEFQPGARKGCSPVDCLTYTVLSLVCFAWPPHTSNRAAIRKHYDIAGDCMGDCCTVICCSSCALAQESRELDLEEEEFARGTGDFRS